MTHRSPYQMLVRSVLAALAIAVGATLPVPVGASAVEDGFAVAASDQIGADLEFSSPHLENLPATNPRGESSARPTAELSLGALEESDGCARDANGSCAPTKNVQKDHQFDDGTWGTRSITCDLREEVEIPLLSAGISAFGISILESLNIFKIVVCDYGPRCNGDIIYTFF